MENPCCPRHSLYPMDLRIGTVKVKEQHTGLTIPITFTSDQLAEPQTTILQKLNSENLTIK